MLLTSCALLFALGIVGAPILWTLAGLLANALLRVPSEIGGEVIGMLHWLAIVIPILLLSTPIRGVIEAKERFDLVNLVAAPSAVALYVVPAAAALLGWSLAEIGAALLVARLAALIAFAAVCETVFPEFWRQPRFDLTLAKKLLGYGGWLTLSGILAPALTYGERFFIASSLGVATLGYYSAPFDMASRVMVIPTAAVIALFPRFSALGPKGRDVGALAARATQYVGLALSPIVFVLVVLGPDLVRIWLGQQFAVESGVVLRVLAVGVLVNSLGYVALALLQGTGRPDVVAKLYLIELVPFVALVIFLVSQFGLVGAGLAWLTRAAADTVLLIASAHATVDALREHLMRRLREVIPLFAVLSLGVGAAIALGSSVELRIAITTVTLGLYVIFMGRLVLERNRAGGRFTVWRLTKLG
jgi:O-antigen/teichoic acid export membrane protein